MCTEMVGWCRGEEGGGDSEGTVYSLALTVVHHAF